MCSAEHLLVSLRAVYEVADCVVMPCLVDMSNKVRGSIQRQAQCLRDRTQQAHSCDHKPLQGSQLKSFQAVPLQSLLHQEPGGPKQRLCLLNFQTAISPKGPGSNDRTRRERLLNTLTSLPIIFVGLHTIRHRESTAGVHFGASLLGVGLAATAYHASSGKLRQHFRKLDYWSISLSTTAAVRAALPAKSQTRARAIIHRPSCSGPFQAISSHSNQCQHSSGRVCKVFSEVSHAETSSSAASSKSGSRIGLLWTGGCSYAA